MNIELGPNEQVLHESFAYHFPDMIGFTGHLYLTNLRLYFVTHPLNFKHYMISLPLSDIAEITMQNRLRIFPHGMNIHLSSGVVHRFAVSKRGKWKQMILAAQAGTKK